MQLVSDKPISHSDGHFPVWKFISNITFQDVLPWFRPITLVTLLYSMLNTSFTSWVSVTFTCVRVMVFFLPKLHSSNSTFLILESLFFFFSTKLFLVTFPSLQVLLFLFLSSRCPQLNVCVQFQKEPWIRKMLISLGEIYFSLKRPAGWITKVATAIAWNKPGVECRISGFTLGWYAIYNYKLIRSIAIHTMLFWMVFISHKQWMGFDNRFLQQDVF